MPPRFVQETPLCNSLDGTCLADELNKF